ncbi:asparagine synthase (glutamine-hydrolyzing) [uncultured Bosea sp.]|uniref:asparagine synthase (glutamine-hydrolyzing) n=1 Tax=uncultured Bosea sp. TaxID=211457 RepID=UPI0025DDE252|nr:asparagine synthase (glutamine-hydrolyzing) [uncultured Bosea sp.]
MCGLVAVFGPQPLEAGTLGAMRDRLWHRGPDDAGLWLGRAGEHHVGLGFRRLAIQDLSPHGAQPMAAAEERVRIVFNGEIYNFVELRNELKALGHSFRSTGDTEVLLAAYLEWGAGCLSRFNGQFAFVLWDERSGTALIARDRFGEKPLYFTRLSGGGIAFASEMKALFAHPDIRPEVNWEHIGKYTQGIADYGSEATCFAGIEQFLAAHAMLLRPDGSVLSYERYWTPQTRERQKGRKTEDLVGEFRERLARSVAMRLRADVTVGACLSGGLDSSSLVALMAREETGHRTQLLHTISARFSQDPTIDEGHYVDEVLSKTCIAGKAAELSPGDLVAQSRALHWHQEAPMMSASAYLEWAVHRAARADGLTVMIDGQGSDELLAGYSYYFAIRQNDWMNTGQWAPLAWNTWLMSSRLKREAAKYEDAARRFSPQAGKPISFYLRTALANQWRQMRGQPLLEQPLQAPKPGVPAPGGGNYLGYYVANGLLYATMPNQLVVSDRNGMASSVETRFPFLDHDFVDWCLGLPEEVLIRGGWLKWILRKALSTDLPPSVAWRVDKVGFQAPQDAWLRGELKDWAYHLLFEGPCTQLEQYDRAALDAIWARHQAGEDLSWSLWIWISLSEWLAMTQEGVWSAGLAGRQPSVGSVANMVQAAG